VASFVTSFITSSVYFQQIISNKYLSSKAEEEMLARPDEIGREEDIQDDLAMLSKLEAHFNCTGNMLKLQGI